MKILDKVKTLVSKLADYKKAILDIEIKIKSLLAGKEEVEEDDDDDEEEAEEEAPKKVVKKKKKKNGSK